MSSKLSLVAIFFYYLIWLYECNSQLGCLISSSIQTQKSGLFSYPIELYGHKALNISDADTTLLYDCAIKREDGHMEEWEHCLPTFPNEYVTCPVLDEFIDIFTKSTTSTGNEDTLCDWKRQLGEKKTDSPMNIFVFGGSVTEGKHTRGCCCTEAKCAESRDHCGQMQNDVRSSDYIRYCAWPRYLFDYLTAKFPTSNIRTFNLGIDAFSSERMYQKLDEKLALVGIKHFSSSDLVILDHSMNVARWWTDGDENMCAETGSSQEILLRGILFRSVGTGPSIVNFEDAAFRGDCDYSYHIRRVSAHYGIHYWTFMDIVWSDSINSLPENARKELQYLVTPPGTESLPLDAHPSWPVHLFWADLLAAAFEQEFIRCDKLVQNSTSSRLRSTTQRDGLTVPKLPLPLYLPQKNEHCRSDLPPLIDLSAHILVDPKKRSSSSTGNIGSLEVFPAGSWPLKEDRAEKFGWISTFQESSSYSTNQTIRFSINNSAPKTKSKLGNFDIYNHSVLSIEYLRTYENAGKVNVYICGKHIATLDAMYEKSFIKKSVPEGYVYIYDMNSPKDSFSYCADSAKPVIEIEHFHIDAHDGKTALRGHEKFRLIQVKLCIMDEKNFAYKY